MDTSADYSVPQIKPKDTTTNDSFARQENEGAILIPKIGFKNDTKESEKKMSTPETNKKRRKLSPRAKKILLGLAGVMGVLVLFLVVVGVQAYGVYKDAQIVRQKTMELADAFKTQNLPLAKIKIAETREQVVSFQDSYAKISWMKSIPLAGAYVKDGEHGVNAYVYGLEAGEIVVTTLEPYADILGLDPNTNTEGVVAQEKLDFVVSTIPTILPKIDELQEKLVLIRGEVDQIDPMRYPEEFQGVRVRELLTQGIDLVDLATEFVDEGRPLLDRAPYLLGTDEEPRTYLVLFQNDKELRPTGGFLTAYTIAKVRKGKFEPVSSSDIYDLDNNYTATVPAPEPYIDYLKGPYAISQKYRLRDMNWDPDFRESMELFLTEAEKAGLGEIDGVIAVDTQLLENILDVIGPIEVAGYGTFSTDIVPECNCPQVIYELESFADVEGAVVWSQDEPDKIIFAPENYGRRKEIIGPLMNQVLSAMLGTTNEKIPSLFEAVSSSVLEKHVLVYFFDEEAQRGAEGFGIAGTIEDYEGDYLHVNDANLGGRKSNMYVTQEVMQEIDVAEDGTVTKTVTLTYNNPEKQDGWLNSVLPNWVRVYVPEGSELVDVQGLQEKEDPYTEHDKTVFAGYFELRPQGVAKIVFTYTLPFKVTDGEYKMFVQKQAGKAEPLYITKIGRKEEEEFLALDKEFIFELK